MLDISYCHYDYYGDKEERPLLSVWTLDKVKDKELSPSPAPCPDHSHPHLTLIIPTLVLQTPVADDIVPLVTDH